MITLPANFEADIQGQNLNLFPFVAIGTWGTGSGDWRGDWQVQNSPYGYAPIINGQIMLFSTKAFSLRSVEWGGVNEPAPMKPLLLNIPSVKESMDFENRNYKISNVTLKLSNYEHNGERFSDYAGNLINKEVRIWWVSQSTKFYHQMEWQTSYPDERALMVYKGFIRRYSHDDEQCTLQLEDSTQRDLHKDVPLKRLEDTDDVPDKYKLKPYPMVYGHVDRSPCVIKQSYIEDELNESYLIFDDKPITEFKTSSQDPSAIVYDSLFIYDEYYCNVVESNIQLDSVEYPIQYIKNEDIAQITLPYYYTGNDANPSNNLSADVLEAKLIRIPDRIVPINNPPYTQWEIFDGTGVHYDYIDYFEDLYKAKDIDPNTHGILNPINIPSGHHAGILCEFISLGLDYECKTFLVSKLYFEQPVEAPDGSAVSNAKLYVKAIASSDSSYTINSNFVLLELTGAGSSEDLDSLYTQSELYLYPFSDEYSYLVGDNGTIGYLDNGGWTSLDGADTIQIYSQTALFYDSYNVSVKYYDVGLLQHFYIEKPLTKDFYANVNGRTDPNYSI